MKLVEIIQKSRRLVNKLFNKNTAKFNKEDYFMLSVSLFIAKKESIIKKNNKNNTLYFDYNKNKKFIDKITLFELVLSDEYLIKVEIPSLGKFTLSEEGCFDNIENLIFPFNQKIEIENFEGSLNELNEIKRKIWIYSKIRDSFVHGDKYSFDTEKNKIIISNQMKSETMGSFQIDMVISPEILNILSDLKYKASNVFYGSMDLETWIRYDQILKDTQFRSLEKIDLKLLEELDKELSDIQNIKELISIANIVKEYKKVCSKMSEQQRKEYSEKIIQIILSYARRNRINQEKSEKIIEQLSDILDTEENLYHLALYSHMIFVFSNLENLSSENLRTKNLKIEDDKYDKIVKKIVKNTNELIDKLMNPHIEKEKTMEYIVQNINHIIEILKIRNRWILNNIRNGIEHKNVKIEKNEIKIFNRQDNTNEEEINFMCTVTYEDIDDLLLSIEESQIDEELSVYEFLTEIRSICGEGENIKKFSKALIIFKKFIDEKNERIEEDEPPKF